MFNLSVLIQIQLNFICFRFLVNAALGSSLSSPLESPDIMQTFIPLSEIGATNTSMASIKLSSADSINIRNQQVRPIRLQSYCPSTPSHKLSTSSIPQVNFLGCIDIGDNNNSKSLSAIPEAVYEIPEIMTATNSSTTVTSSAPLTEECTRKPTTLRFQLNDQQFYSATTSTTNIFKHEFATKEKQNEQRTIRPLVDFNLNSVGRSFIDEIEETLTNTSLNTPETPTPNISPSSSNRFSETFSNDFQKAPSTPSIVVSPIQETATLHIPKVPAPLNFCGSWDLLELDLNFHDVNFDPSFGGDLEECIYFGDDPLGLLPPYPTPPDAFDL